MLNKLMFMGVTGITYTANVISYTEKMYIEEAGITLTLPAYKTENITPTTFSGWYSSATTLPLSSYVNQTITFTLE